MPINSPPRAGSVAPSRAAIKPPVRNTMPLAIPTARRWASQTVDSVNRPLKVIRTLARPQPAIRTAPVLKRRNNSGVSNAPSR